MVTAYNGINQYEITSLLASQGGKFTNLKRNELGLLIFLSSRLNLQKFPRGSLKISQPEMMKATLMGRDAVATAMSGLKDKGLVEYINQWEFLFKLDIIKIADMFGDDLYEGYAEKFNLYKIMLENLDKKRESKPQTKYKPTPQHDSSWDELEIPF